jgi:hyperosmotically inducible protein
MKFKTYSLTVILALPFCALISGCSEKTSTENSTSMSETNSTYTNSTMSGTNTAMSNTNLTSEGTNTMNTAVDNSQVNERDRSGTTLTPGDQGETPQDRDLTQKIRQALVMDTNYSMTAKNIKIITVNGKVTLRGPVNSDAEKTGIESLAKNIVGEGNIDDQLEVKMNP